MAHSVEDTPRKTINYKPPIVLELLGSMLALGHVAESKTTFIELKELRSFSGRQKFIKKNLDAWLPLRLQALNLLGFCLAVPNEQPVSQSAYFFSAAAVQEYNCQSICKWGSPKEGLYKLPFYQMLPGDIVRQNVTSLSLAGHDFAWYSPLEGLLLEGIIRLYPANSVCQQRFAAPNNASPIFACTTAKLYLLSQPQGLCLSL